MAGPGTMGLRLLMVTYSASYNADQLGLAGRDCIAAVQATTRCTVGEAGNAHLQDGNRTYHPSFCVSGAILICLPSFSAILSAPASPHLPLLSVNTARQLLTEV